jgi:NADPH2:quinone reductase
MSAYYNVPGMALNDREALGATVIGTAGSETKAERARAAGADEVILYREMDFVAQVQRLTGGRGVDAVFDGVGGDVLLRSLDCVRPFGAVVSLGQASGALPQIPLTELGPLRSIALARPGIFTYASDPSRYRAAVAELFAMLQEGLDVAVGLTLPLADAPEAHRALEAGETAGSILLDLS